jgi:adenylate kinase family enzyme
MTRIQLIGGSGAGKTTLGRALAAHWRVPFIDLDELYWEPGWREVGHDELALRVAPLAAEDQWVIAGNYFATTKYLVWPRATQLVILDLPYRVLLWRTLRRTVQRAVSGELCCNGNRESLRLLFHRDGLIRYLTRTWRRRHLRHAGMANEPALRHAEVVRLETQRDIQAWFERQSA